MTEYLCILVVLTALAVLESGKSYRLNCGKTACVLLILFGGLRHETGFDWVEYETYYDGTQSIWSNTPIYITANILVEPGFQIYNYILKSFAAPFQAFIFSITLFNMVVIYYFSKKYTNRIALIFLVYFGFVFLAGQMAAIRQTFSYSFIILAFIQLDRRKTFSSFILAGLAISIHTFSLAIIPLLYFKIRQFPMPLLILFISAGLMSAYYGFDIVSTMVDFILPALGAGFLGTKLAIYGEFQSYNMSLTSLLFVPFHLLMYFLLTTDRYTKAELPNRLVLFATASTLISLICHSYFGAFPAFWNRVSYLTFLLQPIALTARYHRYLLSGFIPFASNALAGAAGAAITIYTLSQPSSLPYTPYQNAAVIWFTGEQGDGRLRYAYALGNAEREMATRRR